MSDNIPGTSQQSANINAMEVSNGNSNGNEVNQPGTCDSLEHIFPYLSEMLKFGNIDDLEFNTPSSSILFQEAQTSQNVNQPKLVPSSSSTREGLVPETVGAVDVSPATLKDILQNMSSEDAELQFSSVQLTRQYLNNTTTPPIDTFIRAGIVPRCVQFLWVSQYPALQFEAAVVLTIITAGNAKQTKAVVDAGAIDALIHLMQSFNEAVAMQAIWILGNIIGDGPANRDLVILKGAVHMLVAIAASPHNELFLGKVAWVMSNFFRCNNPPPSRETVELCLPILAELVKITDHKVLSYVCWAFSFLTAGSTERIEEVLKAGVVPRLVELLELENHLVLQPCLRTFANITTGTDGQTQRVVDAGVLPHLKKHLRSKDNDVIGAAARTVTNITAGTTEQVAEAIRAEVVPVLLDMMEEGVCVQDVEYAMANITSAGDSALIIFLFQNKVVLPMIRMLKRRDPAVITSILSGLQNMLNEAIQFARRTPAFCLMAAMVFGQVENIATVIKECGGSVLIEKLVTHHRVIIRGKAQALHKLLQSNEPTTSAAQGQ